MRHVPGVERAALSTTSPFWTAAAGDRAIPGFDSLAARHWVAPLLFDLSARDPVVYLAVAATLAGAALLASLVPARRATRVDPAAVARG